MTKCAECKTEVVHYYRSMFCKDCTKDFFEGDKIMNKDYVEIDGKEIRVYQICESDAVAAEWDTDAVEYYKDLTGLEEDELYAPENWEVIDPSKVVCVSEESEETITVREIVKEHWKGEPFIALTIDY